MVSIRNASNWIRRRLFGEDNRRGQKELATWKKDFDPQWYVERHLDVRCEPDDAWEHFLRHGLHEGRCPTPAEEFARTWRRVFNADWYRTFYDDVRVQKADPWEHFVEHGFGEGRFPNIHAMSLRPKFDAQWYDRVYPDVAQSAMTAWEHFVAYGLSEGRLPHAADPRLQRAERPRPAGDRVTWKKDAIAVCYLARGAEKDCLPSFDRFLLSYARHPAGIAHDLVVLLKGFESRAALARAKQRFAECGAAQLEVDDVGFDIGAYLVAAHATENEFICFLNTHSEILSSDWLGTLHRHARRDGVGLVGATGSLEALEAPGVPATSFPNPHVRSNAFMIRTALFRRLTADTTIGDKADAYIFESGADSLTRRVAGLGLETLVVGSDGRAYQPHEWVGSETFRLADQSNLLVADNHTRRYARAERDEREFLRRLAWGP